jgi:hypothetical protein
MKNSDDLIDFFTPKEPEPIPEDTWISVWLNDGRLYVYGDGFQE